MNNILTFEDYRKMNIKQVESVIYRQFIEEDIKKKDEVNEGFIRNMINKSAGKFIQNALADEIDKGKELEKSIKEALDGLNKGFEELEQRIDADTEKGKEASTKLSAIEKVKEAIKAVQSQAFDTLTMIGSEGEIDFAGFMGSASVAAAANFGILFSPIRSVFMTRKAYKYFLGIIKQTIRRNLLIIQLNFDQFENLILQKSFETEEDSETSTMRDTLNSIIGAMQTELCGKDSKLKFTGKKGKEMKEYLANFKETQNALIRQHKEDTKNNPLRSLWEDQHNNTYTRTLEQIKQYINEDSQKELDALKNSITKMAGNDVELVPYGELLISAAEEYAVHTNHGINNNFIKMSSVFNLDNQKKLIDLIVATQKENEAEIKRKLDDQNKEDMKEKFEESVKSGKKLYEEKLKDKEYTFDEFENDFSEEDIKNLKAFFETDDDGKNIYKELIEQNPLYKYLIPNDTFLNTFLSSISDLKVVEISDMDDFFENIIEKEYTIYSVMTERSIKDAIKSRKSEEYFGLDVNDDDIDSTTHSLKDDIDNENLFRILGSAVKIKRKKKKYYLTFNGSGNNLFNILNKDFKTSVFKDSGEYESDISMENKENIFKLIHKYLKIGNSLSTQFAEYLVRLATHMLLENKNPWFFVKDNEDIIDQNCFKHDADKIQNKNAFVEINQDDYEDIKKFLDKYHNLNDNDFVLESDKKEENK